MHRVAESAGPRSVIDDETIPETLPMAGAQRVGRIDAAAAIGWIEVIGSGRWSALAESHTAAMIVGGFVLLTGSHHHDGAVGSRPGP